MRHVLESIDLLQTGHSVPDTQHLMEQLFIIDEDQLHLRIIENEFQLMDADGRIDRRKDSAYLLDSQIQHDPLRTVLGDNGHLIPSFNRAVLPGDPQAKKSRT